MSVLILDGGEFDQIDNHHISIFENININIEIFRNVDSDINDLVGLIELEFPNDCWLLVMMMMLMTT